MNTDSPRVRPSYFIAALPVFILTVGLATFGCGSSEEGTEDWETQPTVSPTAKLEYRIDSLQNENRRMKDQLDAVSAENRRLTAKNAELETKAAEPTTAPAPATAPTGTVAPASSEVRGGYEAALEQFRSKNYRAAIEQFDALLKSGSEQLADNCHYWIGESYYGLKEYNDAIKHFEMVFNYKQSGKKPYAQLMIGNAYASLGNATAAREAYNKVINDYPASSLVAKAQAKLAKLK